MTLWKPKIRAKHTSPRPPHPELHRSKHSRFMFGFPMTHYSCSDQRFFSDVSETIGVLPQLQQKYTEPEKKPTTLTSFIILVPLLFAGAFWASNKHPSPDHPGSRVSGAGWGGDVVVFLNGKVQDFSSSTILGPSVVLFSVLTQNTLSLVIWISLQ